MKSSVLAIDHGEKRTGFASSDPLRIATRPLDQWYGPGDDEALLKHIGELLEERNARTVLVGLPYNMDGSVGGRAMDVLQFMSRLRDAYPDVQVLPQDERLSTKEAEQLLKEAGHHGEARKSRKDSWSALVLLRDWIDQGEPQHPWPEPRGD
ncbi:MAG: putative Holliday junction resolvase [Candidatus Paceibacteria bacterium]|jgi:putative Holliday junction resolvase